jgi:multidrug transporter EmrE-like cation transporter
VKNFLLILTCVILGVCGQLLLKHGMASNPDRVDEVREIVPRIVAAFLNPIVLLGFFCYFLSAALWLIVLTRNELSYAYPLLSMGYIVVVILSRIFFQEAVTPTRVIGTLVICLGVVLISRTQ